MNVVIADDSTLLRTRLETLISELDEVSLIGQAGSTAETVAAIQQLQPDVVILDINMPGGGGFQVLKTIKTFEIIPVVIVLTAYAEEPFRRKSLELGAAYFFNKATEFDQAIELLRLLSQEAPLSEAGIF